MYCSSCGARLPEGASVCRQCNPRPGTPLEADAFSGVHPVCHIIAGIVGVKVAMSLFGLWQLATMLMTRPGFAQSASFSFLMVPISVYTHVMITVVLMVTMVACVAGLYRKDRRAWGVLLGLRALLLPLALLSSYRFLTFGGGPGFAIFFSLILNLTSSALDVAVIVLLLGYKRQLVR